MKKIFLNYKKILSLSFFVFVFFILFSVIPARASAAFIHNIILSEAYANRQIDMTVLFNGASSACPFRPPDLNGWSNTWIYLEYSVDGGAYRIVPLNVSFQSYSPSYYFTMGSSAHLLINNAGGPYLTVGYHNLNYRTIIDGCVETYAASSFYVLPSLTSGTPNVTLLLSDGTSPYVSHAIQRYSEPNAYFAYGDKAGFRIELDRSNRAVSGSYSTDCYYYVYRQKTGWTDAISTNCDSWLNPIYKAPDFAFNNGINGFQFVENHMCSNASCTNIYGRWSPPRFTSVYGGPQITSFQMSPNPFRYSSNTYLSWTTDNEAEYCNAYSAPTGLWVNPNYWALLGTVSGTSGGVWSQDLTSFVDFFIYCYTSVNKLAQLASSWDPGPWATQSVVKSNSFLPAYCGNGIVEPNPPVPGSSEQCDDGNLNDGDTCSSTCQYGAPVVNFSVSPTTAVPYNGSATISWSSSYATSCTGDGGAWYFPWGGAKALSGSQVFNNIGWNASYPYDQYDINLTCTGAGGPTTAYATVYVSHPPVTVSISTSPASISTGQTSALSWSSTNSTSCTASGDWSGSKALSGSQAVGPYSTASSHSYTLTCSGAGGSANGTAYLTVSSPPSITFSSPTGTNSANVDPGTGTVDISWSVSGATSCTASGGWSGSKPTSGSATLGPVNQDTSYTLTCTGPGGSSSQTFILITNAVCGNSICETTKSERAGTCKVDCAPNYKEI